MLLSVVIGIRAQEAGELPAYVGRQARAWFLGCIEARDPDLAQWLHEGSRLRPYTVSNLYGTGARRHNRVRVERERTYTLRITSLTERLSAVLMGDGDGGMLPAPGDGLQLAGKPFVVEKLALKRDVHPWAGQGSYQALLDECLLNGGRPPRAVTLRFSSPTLVRPEGKDMPLPVPSQVFRSYLDSWNTFSPQALPRPEVLRYVDECVVLSRFEIGSHFVSFERAGKGGQVGFTGQVRFRFLNRDRYWTGVMELLSRYALWCGTGYRTAIGLGQTRLLRRG